MNKHHDKYQVDAAYKAGVDGFNNVMQDFTDGIAKLDKLEVR